MANKVELQIEVPSNGNDVSMSEHDKVVSRMKKETNLDVIQAELDKYKAINIENLSAEEYKEHTDIIRYLKGKLERANPAKAIDKDRRKLSQKYGDKFNV